MSTTDADAADWIVVGGGAAGCVLANRLSADPGTTVLLLEAGPDDAGVDAVGDPARWTSLLTGPHDWGWSYEPTDAVLGRRIPIPRGRLLGGSSSVNAMLWYRGHPADYDAWAAAGATGWDWAAMLPRFRRSEDWAGGASAWRGAGGPMRVTVPAHPHPVATAMLAGAPAVGIPAIEDPNGPSNEGAALANLNAAPDGAGRLRRWSAVRGYLDPVRSRPNLRIRTGAVALAVETAGTRVTGVRVLADGAATTVRAARGIVLALGAIGTPLLLQRSGIGDPRRLRHAGIAVRHALPGVGEGFADHPLVGGLLARADRSFGPVRDNGGGSIMDWRSAAADRPDLHALIVQEAVPADGDGTVFGISPGLMRPASRGHVRLRSADPAAAPEIQPNLLREQADVDRLVEAVERVLDLLATPAYRALGARPLVPFRRADRAAVDRFVRGGTGPFFHCVGGARMGLDEDAVVGPDLAVRGLTGLAVADASVIPVIPTGTTQWPVIALAERAADLLTGKDAA